MQFNNTFSGLKRSLPIVALGTLLVACGGSDSDSGNDSSGTDTTPDVPASNIAPVANAGADITQAVGSVVNLDGTASSDADGNSLSYNWVFASMPDGSNASLNGQTSSQPDFTPDIVGSYQVSLIVNDGQVDSNEDLIDVIATTESVDITNVEFTSRAGSCGSYEGSYFSNVMDLQRAMGFSGDLTIAMSNGDCVVQANDIPNHDFNDAQASFATNVSVQDSNYVINSQPLQVQSSTSLNLGVTNAVMLNGVAIDLLAAACYGVGNEPLGQEKIGCGQDQIDNPWRYDPMSQLNNFGTDEHNAHVQPDGTYHYHGSPMAMYDLDCAATGEVSPVIGFAADGFPVYGPCFQDPQTSLVREAESSFILKANGGARQPVSGYTTPIDGVGGIASSDYDGQFRGDYEFLSGQGDLDECNGMTIDGQYGYYITDSYPWVLNCYKGELDDSFSKVGPALSNLLHSH
ncbi:YHYH protein [Shewanella psychrophila]|uniref:YHYH protein n=2 Tax=Shewanella psychrophila TaxID=225848 RepID=A0A1S6HRF0_9GAMM|nr:YHYH protein [Shewanella psychrophila]